MTSAPPSQLERYCAWYGASDGETLFFGQAPFWSAMRQHDGDPRADLLAPGPQPIGRFDLHRERMLSPIEVGRPGSRSGVWDVHLDARALWFTTFYEEAGRVDLATGAVRRLPGVGLGLNELTDGPAGSVLASRYGAGDTGGGAGSVVALDANGALVGDWPVQGRRAERIAPKTLAWDAHRRRIVVTSDAFEGGEVSGRPAFALELPLRRWQRLEGPELQFVAFGTRGTGYSALVEDGVLRLRIEPPGQSPRTLQLDAAFPAAFDFVQDIQLSGEGHAVLTRWSGRVHVVGPDDAVRTLQLPRLESEGLYYTGVLVGDRVCATYCAGVTVVCADVPE